MDVITDTKQLIKLRRLLSKCLIKMSTVSPQHQEFAILAAYYLGFEIVFDLPITFKWLRKNISAYEDMKFPLYLNAYYIYDKDTISLHYALGYKMGMVLPFHTYMDSPSSFRSGNSQRRIPLIGYFNDKFDMDYQHEPNGKKSFWIVGHVLSGKSYFKEHSSFNSIFTVFDTDEVEHEILPKDKLILKELRAKKDWPTHNAIRDKYVANHMRKLSGHILVLCHHQTERERVTGRKGTDAVVIIPDKIFNKRLSEITGDVSRHDIAKYNRDSIMASKPEKDITFADIESAAKYIFSRNISYLCMDRCINIDKLFPDMYMSRWGSGICMIDSNKIGHTIPYSKFEGIERYIREDGLLAKVQVLKSHWILKQNRMKCCKLCKPIIDEFCDGSCSCHQSPSNLTHYLNYSAVVLFIHLAISKRWRVIVTMDYNMFLYHILSLLKTRSWASKSIMPLVPCVPITMGLPFHTFGMSAGVLGRISTWASSTKGFMNDNIMTDKEWNLLTKHMAMICTIDMFNAFKNKTKLRIVYSQWMGMTLIDDVYITGPAGEYKTHPSGHIKNFVLKFVNYNFQHDEPIVGHYDLGGAITLYRANQKYNIKSLEPSYNEAWHKFFESIAGMWGGLFGCHYLFKRKTTRFYKHKYLKMKFIKGVLEHMIIANERTANLNVSDKELLRESDQRYGR